MSAVLLSVEDLVIEIHTEAGLLMPVAGVSFHIAPGRTLALVGESGSGKSLTGLALLGLLPAGARATGHIHFAGQDVLALPEERRRALRGARLAMIFQEPMTCLNPVLPIGEQVAETLILHERMGRRAALRRAEELLAEVGIADPQRRRHDYPHQLSGGMRQRVMIAAAIACQPDLLVADEPTTALDVTIQAQIVELLADLQRRRGMAMLFISHDLGVVAQVAAEIAVMYSGRIVEYGARGALLSAPRHPYTRGLLACSPELAGAGARRLRVIPGESPNPSRRPVGCAFHPRCERVMDEAGCRRSTPLLTPVSEDQQVACFREET